MGRLADSAAALEEQLTIDIAPQIVSVLDAAGVVALGRVALHIGNPGLTRQAGEIAKVMLGQSAPSVRRHAAWLLALQAMADGDTASAHRWLCALGEDKRLSILPLFPMDVADEARLVHIALAAQDDELAGHAAAAAQRRAMRNPDVPSIAAAAAHATGLAGPAANSAWPKRLNCTSGGPRPLALASALEDLGAAIVQGGAAHDGVEFSAARWSCTPGGSGLGRRQGAGTAQGLGGAAPPGPGTAAGKGLGGYDRLGARRGAPRRARFD